MRSFIVSSIVVVGCVFAPSANGQYPTTSSRTAPGYIVLKPSATTQFIAATITGAATPHDAVSDDDDATYVTLSHPPGSPSSPSGILVDLNDLTLPVGARLDGVRIRARVAAASSYPAHLFAFAAIPLGGSGPSITATVDWTAPTTLSTANLFVGKTDAELDEATHSAALDPAGGPLRVYELSFYVYYTLAPTSDSSRAAVASRTRNGWRPLGFRA